MRPPTAPAAPDTAIGGPLNRAGTIGSEYWTRMGDEVATPLTDGPGSIEAGCGGVMSTVVNDVTYAAVSVFPTRSRMSLTRSVNRVSSCNGASGVKVTVV